MRFTARLSPNAERDFLRAQDYYDEVAPEQTDRFIEDVFLAARLLAEHAEIGRILSEDVRAWPLAAFPYQLWYRTDREAETVRVIAIVGHAQDRHQFADRLI